MQVARAREVPAKQTRTLLYDRHRGYALRESEAQTLADLGKFRVIAADDLVRFAYHGDRVRSERETGNLTRQGLVEGKSVETSLGRATRMYTLTTAGRRFLLASGRVPEQGMTRVNLELTTGDYRRRQLLEKAQAGFTFYSHREEGPRVRRILHNRERTVEIVSL